MLPLFSSRFIYTVGTACFCTTRNSWILNSYIYTGILSQILKNVNHFQQPYPENPLTQYTVHYTYIYNYRLKMQVFLDSACQGNKWMCFVEQSSNHSDKGEHSLPSYFLLCWATLTIEHIMNVTKYVKSRPLKEQR